MTVTVDVFDAAGHGLYDTEPFSVRVGLAVDGVHRAYQFRCHTGIAPELGAVLLEPDAAFRADLTANPRLKGKVMRMVSRLLAGEAIALPARVED